MCLYVCVPSAKLTTYIIHTGNDSSLSYREEHCMIQSIAQSVSFPRLFCYLINNGKSVSINSFLKNHSFLIARNHTHFYWFRNLIEVQCGTNRYLFDFKVLSDLLIFHCCKKHNVPAPGRELWFQQHDLVTESVGQFRCQQDHLKTFRSYDSTADELRRELFKDSFFMDQVLSSSTKYILNV